MNQRRHAIAALINRLLSHYQTEAGNTGAADWVDDLEEFDADTVDAVCREWRRSSTRRPMIAEIRTRCREIAELHGRRMPKSVWDREAYAKSAGFESWAERQAAIEQQQQRYARAEAERLKRQAAE